MKTEKEAKEQDPSGRDFSVHNVTQCIVTLCSATGISTEETNLLLLEAFFPSHHPLVVAAAPKLWIKIVKYHKLSPETFVIQQRAFIRKDLIDSYKVNMVITISCVRVLMCDFYYPLLGVRKCFSYSC